MSQVTGPIVIKNGAATPVDKSFAPIAVSPDLSVFAEKSSAASSGYIKLSIGVSLANGQRNTNRVDINLDLPVTEIVNGVAQVTRTGRFKGYFVIPDAMTGLERADLIAYIANALDVAQIRSVVKDLDPLY